MKTFVICSGGLDSVTLAHMAAAEQTLTRLVFFNQGQRHRTELALPQACAARLSLSYDIVGISTVGRLPTGSAPTIGAV